jgi:hypothetical protein
MLQFVMDTLNVRRILGRSCNLWLDGDGAGARNTNCIVMFSVFWGYIPGYSEESGFQHGRLLKVKKSSRCVVFSIFESLMPTELSVMPFSITHADRAICRLQTSHRSLGFESVETMSFLSPMKHHS